MATLKSLIDETSNIKNELKTCHTNLKNNLIAKGVECSDTDKMSSLIDKVESIPFGKKWATGTVGVDSPYAVSYYKRNGKNTTGNCYSVTVNNLEFDPTLIILVGTESSYTSNISVFDKEYDNNSCSVATCSGVNSSTIGYNVMVNHDTLNVGFGTSLGSFMLPVTANRTYNWIAFE